MSTLWQTIYSSPTGIFILYSTTERKNAITKTDKIVERYIASHETGTIYLIKTPLGKIGNFSINNAEQEWDLEEERTKMLSGIYEKMPKVIRELTDVMASNPIEEKGLLSKDIPLQYQKDLIQLLTERFPEGKFDFNDVLAFEESKSDSPKDLAMAAIKRDAIGLFRILYPINFEGEEVDIDLLLPGNRIVEIAKNNAVNVLKYILGANARGINTLYRIISDYIVEIMQENNNEVFNIIIEFMRIHNRMNLIELDIVEYAMLQKDMKMVDEWRKNISFRDLVRAAYDGSFEEAFDRFVSELNRNHFNFLLNRISKPKTDKQKRMYEILKKGLKQGPL